nr:hypothetical protein BaRGS_026630 [Batillaria attramentaria]
MYIITFTTTVSQDQPYIITFTTTGDINDGGNEEKVSTNMWPQPALSGSAMSTVEIIGAIGWVKDQSDGELENPGTGDVHQESKVYGRRWYVLAVFSLAAMLQGGGWGTWGPITQSAKAVFSWSDGLINIGQTLIGVGGTIPFSGVSLVAATWFPPNQRATATSIASTFAYLDAVDLSSQSEGIMRLMYYEFRKGIPALLRNKRFCQLAVAYCLPIGAYGGFGGIMDIDLNPTGISQAGIMLMVGGHVYETVEASVYASSVLIGVCINGAIPLFYEAACEVSYPVAEGVTTGMLALLNNIVGIIFFALLLVPGIGVVWMNWVLLSCVLAAIPVLLTLKQHYARIDIDTEIHVPDPTHPTIPTTPTPPQPPSPPTL